MQDDLVQSTGLASSAVGGRGTAGAGIGGRKQACRMAAGKTKNSMIGMVGLRQSGLLTYRAICRFRWHLAVTAVTPQRYSRRL
jgi:hypothetical protein